MYLKEIGIKKDIELVPDPVLACQPEGMKSEWLQKHSIQGKVIAVSVRYWDAKEDYMKKLADTLKNLSVMDTIFYSYQCMGHLIKMHHAILLT